MYLVSFETSKVVVTDLVTETSQRTSTNFSVALSSTGMALFSNEMMLIVGGSPNRSARILEIWTGKVTEEKEMSEGRNWPGMLVHKDSVWVFGGNTDPALSSVERFNYVTKSWETGNSMLSPKVCFTPCEHKGLVYLAGTSAIKKQLETLDPRTDTYSLLPLTLQGSLYGCVSFVVEQDLIIVDYNKTASKWRLGSEETHLSSISITLKDVASTYTNTAPIHYAEAIYWLDGSFLPMKFDRKTWTISRLRTNLPQ